MLGFYFGIILFKKESLAFNLKVYNNLKIHKDREKVFLNLFWYFLSSIIKYLYKDKNH